MLVYVQLRDMHYARPRVSLVGDGYGHLGLLPVRSGRPLYHFFFSSRRRHTRFKCDWSSDVCSSDLGQSTAAKFSLPAPTRHGATLLIECSGTASPCKSTYLVLPS